MQYCTRIICRCTSQRSELRNYSNYSKKHDIIKVLLLDVGNKSPRTYLHTYDDYYCASGFLDIKMMWSQL